MTYPLPSKAKVFQSAAGQMIAVNYDQRSTGMFVGENENRRGISIWVNSGMGRQASCWLEWDEAQRLASLIDELFPRKLTEGI